MASQVDLVTGCILGQFDLHHAVTSQRILAFLMNEFDVIVFVPTVLDLCASNCASKLLAEAREGVRLFMRVDQARIASSFFEQLPTGGFFDARDSSVCGMTVTITSNGNRKVLLIGPAGRYQFF